MAGGAAVELMDSLAALDGPIPGHPFSALSLRHNVSGFISSIALTDQIRPFCLMNLAFFSFVWTQDPMNPFASLTVPILNQSTSNQTSLFQTTPNLKLLFR